MSTHQTDSLYTSSSQIHRGLVQYSSTATGEIQVIIPSVTGLNTTVPISYFGREAHPFENDWVVPNVGSSIVVCREDEDYTSVYWLNTTYNPVRADIGEPNDDDQDNPTEYGFGPDGQTGSGAGFELMTVTPTSAGLYLSSTHMGYWTSAGSGAWRTYMDISGNFYLTGSGSATHGLTWTAGTNTLAISGNITIRNASEVLTAIGVTAGAEPNTSAQDNPANYTFGPGLTQTLANITSHPTTAGLFLGGNYMGYHTGTGGAAGWKAYMDSSGNFGLSGSGSHSLSWNGSALTITGTINILNPSDVLTAIGVTAGAVPNPTDYSFGGDATFDLEAVPGTITDDGLYLGSDKLGYHDGTVWKTYMDSGGRFYLGGTSGALQWDGSTLTVTGNIIVSNASTVRSALNVADGAQANTSAQDNPSTYSFSSDGTGATFNLDPVPNSGAAGLHIGSDKLGFWNGSAWKTYMQSNGNFYLSGSGSNSLSWDGSALTISGVITASSFTGGSLSIPQSSPTFSVNSAGALTATSATITGTVNATGGTFTGTVTGGTMQGATITTAASPNARLVLSPTAYSGSFPAYLQGYTAPTGETESYPGMLLFAEDGSNAIAILAAPRYTNSITYTGIKLVHSSTAGYGSVSLGIVDNADALYINATGSGTAKVGIGTITPKAKLHTVGGIAIGPNGATNATDGARNSIQIASDTAYGGNHDDHTGFRIHAQLNATWGDASLHFAGATNWETYGNEVMVLRGTKVGIGTASPTYTLDVTGTSRSNIHYLATDGTGTSPALRFSNDTDAGMYLGTSYMYMTAYGSWKFGASRVSANGVAVNLTTGTGSNYVVWGGGLMYALSSRGVLKENVESISSAAALTRIKALRPVEFNFKQEAVEHGTNDMVAFNRQRGFIAEEVAAVDHASATWGWVNPEDEYSELELLEIPDDLSLDTAVPTNYSQHAIMADIVSVVQDLSTKLEAAESRIAALEAS